jgi:hypothetical protein
VSIFFAPPGESGAHFFVGRESSSIGRRNAEFDGLTKPGLFNDIVRGSPGQQFFSQGVSFPAHRLKGVAQCKLPFRAELIL